MVIELNQQPLSTSIVPNCLHHNSDRWHPRSRHHRTLRKSCPKFPCHLRRLKRTNKSSSALKPLLIHLPFLANPLPKRDLELRLFFKNLLNLASTGEPLVSAFPLWMPLTGMAADLVGTRLPMESLLCNVKSTPPSDSPSEPRVGEPASSLSLTLTSRSKLLTISILGMFSVGFGGLVCWCKIVLFTGVVCQSTVMIEFGLNGSPHHDVVWLNVRSVMNFRERSLKCSLPLCVCTTENETKSYIGLARAAKTHSSHVSVSVLA